MTHSMRAAIVRSAALALAGCAVGLCIQTPPVAALDGWGASCARSLYDGGGALLTFFRLVTRLGDAVVMIALCAAMIALKIALSVGEMRSEPGHWPPRARGRRIGLSAGFYAVLLTGIHLINDGIKHLVQRVRPELTELAGISTATGFSFPSGHSACSMGFYPCALASFDRGERERRWLFALGIAVALTVGVSRVALGVHYPSDVIAGWCFGGAWSCLWRQALQGVYGRAAKAGQGAPGARRVR